MRATVIIFFVLSVKAMTSNAQTVCTAATGDPSHCKCDTPAGVIDVTSLGNPDKTAKYVISDDSGNSYDFNPCYGLSESTCTDTVACQTAGDGLQYGCGQISTGEFLYDESSRSASLKYTGGQDGRISIINLACDENIEGEPTPEADGDTQTPLTYTFTITHKCACPGVCGDDDGGGGGGVSGDISGPIGLSLIILTMAAIGLYFIIGAIVMKFKFQKTGADIIPQKEFWISFPGLLKDGFLFAIGPILRLVRKDGGSTKYDEL